MKIHLKLIALFLASLMLASACGCATPGEGGGSPELTLASTIVPESTANTETQEPETPVETEAETAARGTEPVPETTDPNMLPPLNFGGETIRILYGSDAECNEFNADLSGEILDDSIFARNILIQDQLGVKLEWEAQRSNASNAGPFIQYAFNMSIAGEPFDIYAASRTAMAKMVTSCMLRDFNKIENSHINLSSGLYPENLIEDLTVNGALFLVTGDISANSLLQMNCIFYNLTIAEQLGAKDIVQKVGEGSWTLDTLIKLSKGMYTDWDNSGSKTSVDNYGFCCASYLNLDAFYSGAGLKFFQLGKTSGSLVSRSIDLSSQKAKDLNQKLFGFLSAPDSFVQTSYTIEGDYNLPFVEGRALFCHNVLGLASTALSKVDFEYGILPVPKYDVNQRYYVTTLSNKAVFWGIHLNSAKNTISSAVIEALAYAGNNSIAPTVFESTMKYRYSSNYNSAAAAQEVYDLMRSSISVDPGKLFTEDTAVLTSTFAQAVTLSERQWESSVALLDHEIRSAENKLSKSLELAIEKQNKE